MSILNKVRHLLILPIRAYQKWISPKLPARCKYYPTCSAYACTAILRFGIFLGGALALWRILRCNPWSKGGYDPVPTREQVFKRRKNHEFVELFCCSLCLDHAAMYGLAEQLCPCPDRLCADHQTDHLPPLHEAAKDPAEHGAAAPLSGSIG